jgi:hypothetical protein
MYSLPLHHWSARAKHVVITRMPSYTPHGVPCSFLAFLLSSAALDIRHGHSEKRLHS